MGLNVKFDINKTELLVGEHPICILTLENTGPELLKVIHPDCGKGMPCFRLTEVKSGAETFIRGETSRGHRRSSRACARPEITVLYLSA